jgi:G3E family GTPase
MTEQGDTTSRVLPVTVLTGFLGAGKTTLLNRLIQSPLAQNAAVIVNEFGEIGIDHLLVATADEGIFEMSSGCLCCTIRSDLANTLENLMARRDEGAVKPFDRVIIETTGLADPAPILHTFMSNPMLFLRFRLDGVVTVVDGVHGLASLNAQPEAVKQAAIADRLVISKQDLPEARDKIDPLKQRLAALNPAALVLDASMAEQELGALFNAGLFDPETRRADVSKWLKEEAHDHAHMHHDVNRHDDRIRSFCVTSEAPIGEASLGLFFDLVVARHGDDMLRCKGIVKLEEAPDRPVVVHGVQHMFHPAVRLDAWPDDDQRTRLVFIMRDVDRQKIETLFKGFTGKADREATIAAFEPDRTLSVAPKGGLLD